VSQPWRTIAVAGALRPLIAGLSAKKCCPAPDNQRRRNVASEPRRACALIIRQSWGKLARMQWHWRTTARLLPASAQAGQQVYSVTMSLANHGGLTS
jgi:hypothetical protein